MFDQDGPRVREAATQHTVTPGGVFIPVEFETEALARERREKLLASGVLNRFADKDLPRIVEVAEATAH